MDSNYLNEIEETIGNLMGKFLFENNFDEYCRENNKDKFIKSHIRNFLKEIDNKESFQRMLSLFREAWVKTCPKNVLNVNAFIPTEPFSTDINKI